MNYVLVRTKLQALIVLELLKRGVIGRPFAFAPLYQLGIDEDSESVRRLYDSIAHQAAFERAVLETNGFFRNTLAIAANIWRTRLSGGTVYASVLNSYPLALALKLTPGVRLVSFDDGTANVQVRDTSYHSELPLPGGGIKRRIARTLFPRGAAKYVRGRIHAHYTIYPGLRNVVPADKLLPITIDWLQLVSPADRASLRQPVTAIFIGSVYASISRPDRDRLYEWAIACADLYVPHPREKRRPAGSVHVLESRSSAESVVNYILSQGSGTLTLFHFNSSVALSFNDNPRVRSIDLERLPKIPDHSGAPAGCKLREV